MDDHSMVKTRRCSMCGINYPPFVAVCRACGDDTWAMGRGEPDENWQELVEMHKKRIESNAPESVYPHKHDNQAQIYRDSGDRLWVAHTELLANGYRLLTEDTIVFLNEKFYELQGFTETASAWLIEEVKVDGVADSLEPQMFDGTA